MTTAPGCAGSSTSDDGSQCQERISPDDGPSSAHARCRCPGCLPDRSLRELSARGDGRVHRGALRRTIREALNRFSLGIERVQQRHQPGDGEEVMISRVDAQQGQPAPVLHNRSVGGHELAQTTAVDLGHVLEIEEDAGIAIHWTFVSARPVDRLQPIPKSNGQHARDRHMLSTRSRIRHRWSARANHSG
jgi:hypothetical protein